MRIYAFEVREDEKETLKRTADQFGVELILSPEVPSPENAASMHQADGVSILGMGKIDRQLLEIYREKGVQCLSTRTIGYNHIDLEAAKELRIAVCNASYPPNGVADFTVMMILMCLRQYKQAMWRGYVNDFSLKGLLGQDLNALTVGVMGTGKIGEQVIRNLSGFGCKILAYDLYKKESVMSMAEYVDLDTLLEKSDIITLHMPLLPETRHLISSETISKMKDGVILVNCARGELCNIEALVEGIESQKIGALGMDTMEGEQSFMHEDRRSDILTNRNWFYLHQFRNVIMTQHMAFYTLQAVEAMAVCGIEGIVSMYQNGKYRNRLV